MAKSIAVQKSGKAIGKAKDYRTELAAYAKEDSARLPSGTGSYISIRGKNFSFQGSVLDEPLAVVILDYSFENALYEGKWDPENPRPPVCFAVAKSKTDLGSDENSPKRQSEDCKDCDHNQFGSADTGKGKSCKNSLRLAVLSTTAKQFNADFVEKSEVAMIRLPPTSMKHFQGYVKKITEGLQLPLFSVVTELGFEEDSATPVVIPQFGEEIDDRKLLQALIAKRESAQEQLLQPFDVSNYEEQPKKKEKKPVKKTPSIKKSKF